MAKIKKARKPSQRDKEIKAKRTGYRFKTEGNPKLHKKKDGSLNKKGEELYYKKPTADEIEKYKKTNNKYPDADGLRQIYHERRANRKHSDDNLTKKYDKGGRVYKEGLAYKLERAKHNKSEDWEVPMSKRKKKFDNGGGVTDVTKNILKEYVFEYKYPKHKNKPSFNQYYSIDTSKVYPIGGMSEDGFMLKFINGNKSGTAITVTEALQAIRNGEIELEQSEGYFVKIKAIKKDTFANGGDVKQNKAQSESYSKKADKLEKAKPVGMRYTDKLAKKLGKRVREEPTKKDVEKYLGKGVYDEKREDKSDISISKKFDKGGKVFDDSKGGELKVGDSVILTNVSDLDVEGGKLFVGKKLTVNKLIDLESNYISFKDERGEVFDFYGYHVDKSISNKFEEGGETEPNIELSLDEMKASLGREPKYPYDFIKGKKYVKCFLRPYYKLVD